MGEKKGPEPGAPPINTRLHRAQRDAHDLRDFRVVEALNVTENDRQTLVGGQGTQRFLERPAQLGGLGDFSQRRARVLNIRYTAARPARLIQGCRRAGAPSSQLVVAGVCANAEQPRAEASRAATPFSTSPETADRTIGGDKRLLAAPTPSAILQASHAALQLYGFPPRPPSLAKRNSGTNVTSYVSGLYGYNE